MSSDMNIDTNSQGGSPRTSQFQTPRFPCPATNRTTSQPPESPRSPSAQIAAVDDEPPPNYAEACPEEMNKTWRISFCHHVLEVIQQNETMTAGHMLETVANGVYQYFDIDEAHRNENTAFVLNVVAATIDAVEQLDNQQLAMCTEEEAWAGDLRARAVPPPQAPTQSHQSTALWGLTSMIQFSQRVRISHDRTHRLLAAGRDLLLTYGGLPGSYPPAFPSPSSPSFGPSAGSSGESSSGTLFMPARCRSPGTDPRRVSIVSDSSSTRHHVIFEDSTLPTWSPTSSTGTHSSNDPPQGSSPIPSRRHVTFGDGTLPTWSPNSSTVAESLDDSPSVSSSMPFRQPSPGIIPRRLSIEPDSSSTSRHETFDDSTLPALPPNSSTVAGSSDDSSSLLNTLQPADTLQPAHIVQLDATVETVVEGPETAACGPPTLELQPTPGPGPKLAQETVNTHVGSDWCTLFLVIYIIYQMCTVFGATIV